MMGAERRAADRAVVPNELRGGRDHHAAGGVAGVAEREIVVSPVAPGDAAGGRGTACEREGNVRAFVATIELADFHRAKLGLRRMGIRLGEEGEREGEKKMIGAHQREKKRS